MIEIRPLSGADSPAAISDIYELSWKYAYRGIIPDSYLDGIPSGQWAGRLTQPDRFSLVLTEDSVPCGTCAFGRLRLDDMSEYGEIIAIYLLPDKMRKGYGSRLMKAALSELKRMGYSSAYLWVLEENASARRFYEKLGFAPCGRTCTAEFCGKELTERMYIRPTI